MWYNWAGMLNEAERQIWMRMERCIMRRGNSFTLIELLVVIAVITLLLAILMPAMARVLKKSRTVVCMANLEQWGIIFTMHADDNNGLFQKGWVGRQRACPRWMDAGRLYCKCGSSSGIVSTTRRGTGPNSAEPPAETGLSG